MSRLVALLRYFAEDALEEWRHSPGVTVLATATLVAVLFVAGVVVLVLANVSSRLEDWRGDLRVEIFLRDDATDAEIAEIESELGGLAGVAHVVHVGKDEALARFRRTFKALAEVPSDLSMNPLPASLEVYLSEGPSPSGVARAVATTLEGIRAVEEVRYDQELLDRVDGVLDVARWTGAGLGVLVLGALAFVMAGVMRLAVYARRDEVDIMLLVGASPGFVRGPFLLAGGLQGLIGGLIAVALVEVARRAAFAYMSAAPTPAFDLVLGAALSAGDAAFVVAAGVVVGLSSAWFAVRRVAD